MEFLLEELQAALPIRLPVQRDRSAEDGRVPGQHHRHASIDVALLPLVLTGADEAELRDARSVRTAPAPSGVMPSTDAAKRAWLSGALAGQCSRNTMRRRRPGSNVPITTSVAPP